MHLECAELQVHGPRLRPTHPHSCVHACSYPHASMHTYMRAPPHTRRAHRHLPGGTRPQGPPPTQSVGCRLLGLPTHSHIHACFVRRCLPSLLGVTQQGEGQHAQYISKDIRRPARRSAGAASLTRSRTRSRTRSMTRRPPAPPPAGQCVQSDGQMDRQMDGPGTSIGRQAGRVHGVCRLRAAPRSGRYGG